MNQVVYVLVSSEMDYYLEELIVSSRSLKMHNPSVKSVLFVDDITYNRIQMICQNVNSNIFDDIDEIIPIKFDSALSSRIRSRYLKTSIRELVKGDFLYIDCDTIISGSIEDLFNNDKEIGMVLDGHKTLSRSKRKDKILKFIQVFEPGTTNIDEKYFNGGVCFCKDTENAHIFYKKWKDEYIKSNEYGNYQDQPPLQYVNSIYPGLISEIDGIYNCQMDSGVKYLYDARIIHYLGFQYEGNKIRKDINGLMHEICNEKLFWDMRKNNYEITKSIEDIISNPKGSIRDVITIPVDSHSYDIIKSNQFLYLLFKKVYMRALFNMQDRFLGFILKIYQRIKRCKI